MIKLIKGDITQIDKIDAIVNAANKSLLGGGGVDGAIHRAAGPKLLAACIKLHGCRTGEAKITLGYNLPCKYIIHTVGPVWHGGKNDEEQLLTACYENAMKLAQQHGLRTIAFPSISTGVYHYPCDLAAKTAISTVKKYVEQNPESFDLVEWVLFDDKTYATYLAQLET